MYKEKAALLGRESGLFLVLLFFDDPTLVGKGRSERFITHKELLLCGGGDVEVPTGTLDSPAHMTNLHVAIIALRILGF